MIVIDSGLGGLSVVRALRALAPDCALTYIADTAGFPYGARDAAWLTARANTLVAAIMRLTTPRVIVLACNTLSTLALEPLRAQWPMAFVGTVPAIKVAAEQSRTRRFTLLATANTAQGDYVSTLIQRFAADCVVDCFGAPNLARYAEQLMLGESLAPGVLRAEITPCFKDDARGKTDHIILGCTHYPLIMPELAAASLWPVGWVDPSSAIARRALSQSPPQSGVMRAYLTSDASRARYEAVFAREGFSALELFAL